MGQADDVFGPFRSQTPQSGRVEIKKTEIQNKIKSAWIT